MSCFCCPCRFESRKNPHFGVQKGVRYELYINKDGIFRVVPRFEIFVKMPAPGTFLCFASVIFPRRFVVMPCSRVCQRSFLRPPSSVSRFLALHRGAPRRFFLHASSLFAFSRLPAPPLGRFSPAPGMPVFAPLPGGFPRPRLGVLCLLRRACRVFAPLRAAFFAPAWVFVVSRAARAGFLLRCGRVSAPPLGLPAPPLGRSWSPAPGMPIFAPLPGGFPRRGRIPIGKQALPRSAGKRKAYRKRRKLTNELPPLLNGIIGHALRFAPAALLPRNIRYGKTACRPTLPVSRG